MSGVFPTLGHGTLRASGNMITLSCAHRTPLIVTVRANRASRKENYSNVCYGIIKATSIMLLAHIKSVGVGGERGVGCVPSLDVDSHSLEVVAAYGRSR